MQLLWAVDGVKFGPEERAIGVVPIMVKVRCHCMSCLCHGCVMVVSWLCHGCVMVAVVSSVLCVGSQNGCVYTFG